MFDIGGQGRCIIGSIVAVWAAWSCDRVWPALLARRPQDRARLPGGAGRTQVLAAWSRRRSGREVMFDDHARLDRVLGRGLPVRLRRPTADSTDTSVPISNDIAANAHLHVFCGNPDLQGLHVGFFIAIAALVFVLDHAQPHDARLEESGSRFNPEAHASAGSASPAATSTAMAISGAFAALAGAIDILGWRFRLGQLDVQASNIGFTGIAVALLGRNTAIGVFFSALLFGGLINGTSGRHLSADVFPPTAR